MSLLKVQFYSKIFSIFTFLIKSKDIHYQILKYFLTLKINIGKKILLQVFKNNTFCTYGVLDTPPKLWDSTLYLKNIKFNKVLFQNYILYSSPIYAKLVNSNNSFINKRLILIESLRYKKNFSLKEI